MSNNQESDKKGLSGREIPTRRVVLNDQNQIPSAYSTTPGGTWFSTTPGGLFNLELLHFWNVSFACRNQDYIREEFFVAMQELAIGKKSSG